MRLDRFNPANIRVRRGGAGGNRGFPGGGGTLGCGTLVIVIVAALVFGVDPVQLLTSMEGMEQQAGPAPQGQAGKESVAEICGESRYSLEACNALDSLNQTWEPVFRAEDVRFTQPTLTFYRGGTRSGCGAASSSTGPFYCPADQSIYIDTSFYDQLARQLGAPGDFARYYVIAHEYGHHLQKLVGLADEVHGAQQHNLRQANALQVLMELQADCYAGVWAGKNRGLIEPGDMEEGLTAAGAIGDDTLQRNAGRSVDRESFTHGSSAQRMQWLKRGLATGDAKACDTFADTRR